jgi:hypothetical protein
MDFNALTIDTNIFEKYKNNLDSGILKALSEFKDKPIPLVISSVVWMELTSHLEAGSVVIRKALKNNLEHSINAFSLNRLDVMAMREVLIPSKEDLCLLVQKRLNNYKRLTGLEVIGVENNLSLDNLMDKYFTTSPPFGTTQDKKNEFPDAIALMSLDAWAAARSIKLLAVSKDKGWIEYAKTSLNIVVIDDLVSAIALCTPSQSAVDFCQFLQTNSNAPIHDIVRETVGDLLDAEVPNFEITADSHAGFHFEFDNYDVELDYDNFESHNPRYLRFEAIQANSSTLYVKMMLNIDIEASISYEVEVYDGIDKEYVHMGSNSAQTEAEIDIDLLLKFRGDFSSNKNDDFNNVTLESVEVLSYTESIDFGELSAFD